MDLFVIALILVIGGITGIVLYEIYLSEPHLLKESTTCFPDDLSKINVGFPFKLPTLLPEGYSLQGIENDRPDLGLTLFFYGTHPVCRVPHFNSIYKDTQLVVRVIKVGNSELYSNGTQKITSPMTSLEFQQATLKTEHNLGLIQFSKAVDVNPYKGWISFDNTSVNFLNDKDQVLYGVGANANLTLNQILEVARSIPP